MKKSIFARAINDALTDSTNVTFDLFRILTVIAIGIGIALVVAAFFLQRPFDLQAYGLGVSALLVAGAAALRIQAPTATTSVQQTTTVTESQ